MQLAKAVASAAAALVLKAKNVAQKTEDSALQTQVIAAATQCALSTSQLVACTKVSGTHHHPAGFGTANPGSSPPWRSGKAPGEQELRGDSFLLPCRWWLPPSAPRCARSS